jgi:sec-independent protein translocase protein TatA
VGLGYLPILIERMNFVGIGNMGWSGFVLLLVALLLVFGPSKLPAIGHAFGKSLREFKNAANGIMDRNLESSTNLMEESGLVESSDKEIESKSALKGDSRN